ncbi:hypothetical protein [Saccharopolyspora aridisoli]|uniref:hypothetical protein n=1 Tax=Saccharopolyspora aridisoli TaxID=2530385 RepID=UPI001A9CE7FF|nr:hypothetical protein [Saccharopolyspora aridisoli]
MSSTLDRFLPACGDSRYLVGGGHGTPTRTAGGGPPGDAGLPGADRAQRDPSVIERAGAASPRARIACWSCHEGLTSELEV